MIESPLPTRSTVDVNAMRRPLALITGRATSAVAEVGVIWVSPCPWVNRKSSLWLRIATRDLGGRAGEGDAAAVGVDRGLLAESVRVVVGDLFDLRTLREKDLATEVRVATGSRSALDRKATRPPSALSEGWELVTPSPCSECVIWTSRKTLWNRRTARKISELWSGLPPGTKSAVERKAILEPSALIEGWELPPSTELVTCSNPEPVANRNTSALLSLPPGTRSPFETKATRSPWR